MFYTPSSQNIMVVEVWSSSFCYHGSGSVKIDFHLTRHRRDSMIPPKKCEDQPYPRIFCFFSLIRI